MRQIIAAILAPILMGASPADAGSIDRARAAITALDTRQKEVVARADIVGLVALAAPNLIINAPDNHVLTAQQYIDQVRNGEIGTESFERQIESVTVTGDVGVVMGSERVVPTARSELGRQYGVRPLQRRYTNVYQRLNGQWKWIARHANIVGEKPITR